MNKWFAITGLFLCVTMLTRCNLFDGNSKEVNSNRLLNHPPFDNITDSISKFPDNAGLYLNRAELLSQKNLPELAFSDYQKAWNLNPDESTTLLFTANLFITGREERAIELLQVSVKKFPGNNEFLRRLSEAYLQSGNSKKALQQFSKLIETDSNNFEAWYEKGLILVQLKDTMNAIRSFERAYNLQPLQLVGLSLANLYAETKNQKVLQLCDELIIKDSAQELTDAFFIKGIYYANTNQQDLALEQFENCINRDWKFTDAYIEKGIILFNDRNIDEALKTFALAAKVSNTYPDAYYWMGRCYENIGKTEEARDNYLRAIALDRNFKEAKESLRKLK